MDIAAEDKKLARLTNPGPDDQLREILRGSNFEDYKAPLFIAWQLNSACNLRCLHCCEESGHSMPDEMTKEEALDFCGQIAESNIPYVAISGGEPMLCPYFFEVCEFIRNNSISLKIETNGEFIDEQAADRLAELKLRSVQISLDGATPETHERLRAGGNWAKAVSACKCLIKGGVNTEIVFVPTKFNYHEIGDIIDMAYSMGAYGVYTGKTMRIGRAAKNWDTICSSLEEYDKFFNILKEKADAYEGKMKVYYYPSDIIEELKYRLDQPAASLLILPNGKVKLISALPFICGDLKKQSLREVWQNYRLAWRNPKVVDFAEKVIADPQLLAQSNNWIEI
ncbi:MAG: hypothetical protein CVV39_02415 [Planctomycetes bacterium HGW-Planctomycetes-1]|nr:MAG: hypothetical protein CVV39_02415 [Planctomycetes bacterium HGW-Planctomycetes-1]